MTPGFSVKFVINRITGNYKIQITNTTDYSGVATAYGFYRIEYPDGIFSENTNPSSPDFQIGQNLSEFNLRMINGKPATGQFKITQKTYANTGYFSGEKTFVFSFVEPELKLVDSSNLASPTVSFTDATNYNLGAYTEDITRLIVSNFPATLPFSSTVVTSIGSVLNMVYSGNYYEGVYNPNLSASVVLTGTDHTIEWTKSASFTFDIRKLLTYVELLSYLDVAKSRYDQAKGTTNESKERENYQLVASIVEHIKLKSTITNQGIAELMFEVQDIIYKITCTFTDNYVYSVNPLVPIDESFFTEGVPLSRILTINGVSYDLTQDRIWNVGTVTSVNIQVPTWMTVSGGPITQSGVFQLGLAAGYYIPTTADVVRWDIDTFVTGVSVTGTSVKTISLTRNDGVVLTAQWNDIDTFPVTSVNGKTGDVVLVTGDIAEGGSPANLWFTQARARSSVSLTTTGNSGAATYSSSTGVFNIPNYTLEGLGGVPLTRQLTINGFTFDLSANRAWNVGTVTQINTGAGLIGGPIVGTGTISHADTSALSGPFGGSGISSVTVDEFGHVTAIGIASYVPISRTLTINGQSFDLSENRSWSIITAQIIQDNGSVMTQRTNLNFVRMTLTDDAVNNRTTVTRPPSVTISLSPPTANILEGDEWINSETWSKYAWYDGYWVQVNKKCGIDGSGTAISGPLTNGYVATIIAGAPTWSLPSLVVDSNKVSYNVADLKNATERNQARVNIGSTSATPQVIATAGAINDLTVTSNSLVFTGASVVLSGIVAGLDGEEIAILNASGTNLELLSQSVLSSANNRFASGVIVPNLSIVRLKYRTTTARWVLENVGINDGRYVRKDVADTKTGNLTLTNAAIINGHLDVNGSTSASPGVALNRIRNAVAGSGITQFFGTNGGSVRQHFAFYGSGDVEYLSLGNGWISSGVPTLRAVNAILLQGNAFSSVRSVNNNFLVRRDELYLNYSQTVATAGTINDLAINVDCKLLILTASDDLTGVIPVDNTRLLRIEASGANRIIRHESASSAPANRFSIGADLTINAGEVYQFIYTSSRWRRVL